MLTRLRDPSSHIAAADLRALSALTPAQLRGLAPVWPKIAVAQRRKLVRLMCELAEDNVELDYNDIMAMAVRDPDEEVRRAAVEGLWEDERASTALALVGVLRGDPVPAVRSAAATSLAHFVALFELRDLDEASGRQIVDALYEVIDNPAEPLDVRRRAVEAIGYLSEQRAVDIIAHAYSDPNPKMKVSAVFGMGRSSDRRWLGAVLAGLRSPSPEMRFEAARASGELEDEAAVPALINLLSDADREVCLAAVTSLGQIGGQLAKEALTRVAAGPDPELATAAEEALDEMQILEDPRRFRAVDADE